MLKKFQQLLFYSIILFLPTQLGKHFWPVWSYVSGLRVDYLSPTLYFTDVLIILLFFLWVFKNLNIKNFNPDSIGVKLKIILFILFLLIGIFFSKNPMAGLYGLLKLLEFGFFGWYTSQFIKKKKEFGLVVLILSFGICFESLLAIAQYINQGSIGGIFYFFGERAFTSVTPGVANASLDGRLVLRPYATFPHPNVLASYLVITMTFIIYHLKKYFFIFPLLIGTIAIFLSMSRVAIIIWAVIAFLFIFKNFKLKISIIVMAMILIIFMISPFHFRFSNFRFAEESIVKRQELIYSAGAMVKENPLIGVGLNNFLPNLSLYQKSTGQSLFSYLQPVHNVFFLIVSEIGIIGLLFFLLCIIKTYKRFKIYDLRFTILTTILVLGMFDHYFLTLQQGQLLLTFVLGLCWSKIKLSV